MAHDEFWPRKFNESIERNIYIGWGRWEHVFAEAVSNRVLKTNVGVISILSEQLLAPALFC
jgi:hypothetical protein